MHTLYGIIPASGSGSRLGSSLPKQFLNIAGRPMVDHAIAALLSDDRIKEAHVICAPTLTDAPAPGTSLAPALRERVTVHHCGGATRVATVAAAAALFAAEPGAWLAVHDAARPCLHPADLKAVLDATADCTAAALLAEPLAATLKQGVGTKVAATIDRSDKWLAQTPQVAAAKDLHAALADLPDVTDEASALEQLGIFPTLVANVHPNPKITTSADFALGEIILQHL